MPQPDRSDVWARAAFYAGLSFIVPASSLVGYGAGWFLDKHLHTGPVLAVVGALAGTALGIVDVIRTVIRKEKNAGGR
ncbi:MAG TPA: AtpZ/AtpI family protein [Terriglobia bacterium]|nr:AtpZ/AtpI family protein [Terriglobia bacterium]